jgi:lipopolysaccharide/colanic/teichoic acid biosynthesis glycosyltransferase
MDAEQQGSNDSTTVPYPLAKRALDRVGGVVLALAASPLFVAAGVALAADALRRHDERGPWLYRERRISRGREFELLKFRTLRLDALERMRRENGHAREYEADSANLTHAGRFLKRRYLDELPQLVNVVKGDLSLVGPRPWPRSMVERQVEGGADYRLTTMAGLTGPVQATKGETPLTRYAATDLAYVDACRRLSQWQLLRHDLAILRETVHAMRRGEGLQY